jgi:hypothetical protein
MFCAEVLRFFIFYFSKIRPLVMRTKMKPKIELSSMLDKNVKLAGRKDVHLKSWLENCKNL